MHPWQITAWLNRDQLTPEDGAYRLGVETGTLNRWRDTCERFTLQQANAIAEVMGVVPPMPAEQPVLWCNPQPWRGKPGVLSGEQVTAKRQALRMGQRDFARALGLSTGYLHDIESGKRRCTERVATLLAALERKQHAETSA